jgi:hypothetical protein
VLMQAVILSGGAAILVIALRWAVRRESDPFIARVVVLGFFAKLVGIGVRYYFLTDVYERGDASRYLDNGQALAPLIRAGTLPDQARETGTPFMDFIAGVFYAVAPPSLVLGFIMFGLLAFVGAYGFLQAFRLALPDGDHRRYACLIMFMPTMLFWPSSLGKEAWLVFGLGIAAYGAARVLVGLHWGYLIFALGGAAVYQVRPHMGALVAISFAAAFVLRLRDPAATRGVAAWLAGLVLVVGGAVFTYQHFGDRLPRDESVEGSTTEQIFAETERRSSQGGSAFDSRPVRNPTDLLHAFVTVPFRPFPTEAHNLQAQVAALEGVLLFTFVLFSLPRLRRLPRELIRRPYVAMVTAYSVGFIIGFSNVGNFGILTRQRAQLLPFLVVLLALPAGDALIHNAGERGQPRHARARRVLGPPVAGAESETGSETSS